MYGRWKHPAAAAGRQSVAFWLRQGHGASAYAVVGNDYDLCMQVAAIFLGAATSVSLVGVNSSDWAERENPG